MKTTIEHACGTFELRVGEPTHVDQKKRRRRFSVSRLDGTTALRGTLDSEGVTLSDVAEHALPKAAVIAALDRLLAPKPPPIEVEARVAAPAPVPKRSPKRRRLPKE